MKYIALAGLLAMLPLAAYADDAPVSRTLTADVPAAGLHSLALDVAVGEVNIEPSSDDAVHVQVELRQKEDWSFWFFRWSSSGTAKDIAAAAIEQHKSGDRLSLSLAYPSDHQDNIKQKWEVRLPVRLALETKLSVGQLTIDGVAGGVEATLNVGELRITVPQGPIRAEVNVGEILAATHTKQAGDVSIASNIGDAVLYVDGEHAGFHDHSGLGNQVNWSGKGTDRMKLSVNVGSAMLKVLPPAAKN